MHFFLRVETKGVPSLMEHRRDYLDKNLIREKLWKILDLDEQFLLLLKKKEAATSVEEVADVLQCIQIRGRVGSGGKWEEGAEEG
ncbi:hypothetical protein HDV00_008347 [Rhizophlyctis rosea]|nr:hypothetical protein HDV00_008347 [Rhizophlyctis rosea]